MLSIHDLSFSYGAIPTLRGINMEMAQRRVTCVMGRNGVGKTTLMRNIMGVLRSSADRCCGDKDLTALAAHRRARAGLALVPQGRDIFPKLTVEENLRIGLEARADRSRTIPEEVYALFPVLKTMARRMGGDLSGGQQQQLGDRPRAGRRSRRSSCSTSRPKGFSRASSTRSARSCTNSSTSCS